MHSFASNFKNFTNQNHHFFTPLRPPPLGGTAALFLPFIFLALLQTPNLKPQCILLHLTSRILQIRTHIFCHTTQGPPGGHCCNVFPLCFVLFLNPKPYTSMHSFAFNFKILETNQNSHFFTPETCFPLSFWSFSQT